MTVDDRLRAAHTRVPDPDEATVARARASLLAAMGTDAPQPAARRRPRFALVLPIAALALVALVVVALVLPSGEAPVAPPTAAPTPCAVSGGAPGGCLEALAAVAAAQPVSVPADEIVYWRNTFRLMTRYIGAGGKPEARPGKEAYAISRSVPEELWLAPDGSGRLAYGKETTVALPSPKDERAWRAAGSPDLEALMGPAGKWGPKRQDFGPGELEATLLLNSNLDKLLPKDDPLSALPLDPRALAAFLDDLAVKQRPKAPKSIVREAFSSDIVTFLRYPRTPPALRAALLRVLADPPGTTLIGPIDDPAGRPAIAIGLTQGLVLAFDPATGRLLAEGSRFAGTPLRWHMTYALAMGPAANVGDRP